MYVDVSVFYFEGNLDNNLDTVTPAIMSDHSLISAMINIECSQQSIRKDNGNKVFKFNIVLFIDEGNLAAIRKAAYLANLCNKGSDMWKGVKRS